MQVEPTPSVGGFRQRAGMVWMTLAALGVVFGDIGTSPLYAMRECFHASQGGLAVDPANVLGVLSLIIWSLLLIISVQYLVFVLRADLRGEGGLLALMLLVTRNRKSPRLPVILTFVGILGATLICGDAVITPAISVLSAVEGLNQITPAFKPVVVPMAVAILVMLFFFQRHGTARLGVVFGPVVLVWYVVMAWLGLTALLDRPDVLHALNPVWAVRLFWNNGLAAFRVLSSVFLVLTGAEAMYADLGHFGRTPIRLGWYLVALPGLLLNYLGQGALLLSGGESLPGNLFYRMVSPGWLYPLVILATMATIIASQAVITGAFSLARQAVQLGLWPRIAVVHTSARHIGQVYVPGVNVLLGFLTVALVLGFRDSGRLAGAYGIAVSMAMVLSKFLVLFALQDYWSPKVCRWLRPLMLVLLAVDVSFLASCFTKVWSGGWVALSLAGTLFLLAVTWRRGRAILREASIRQSFEIPMFVADIPRSKVHRTPGTAVFLAGNWKSVPRALLHNIKHNRVLHEQTVILSVQTEEVPRVADSERVEFVDYGHGMYGVLVKYGFSEDPDLPTVLKTIRQGGLSFDPARTTYFLGKETLVLREVSPMARWRRQVFAFLSRNASDPSRFFRLPANRVVELGLQIEL
ncbi:MAG: hypothetical protein A2498_06615 [Lentisphaerae bacterium RIFOXYC12_FULL_60_16]|nr:MAG: hypothetical protein A2498_06615 [Lentisphaerae bacterium RIFOXYC12_FULL_60_16]